MSGADTIITGGVVVTGDMLGDARGAAGRFSAVAVKNGTIVGVGDDAEIKELAGPRTERIDVGGRAVLPAFIDSHTHFRRASLVLAYYIDFMTLGPHRLADVLDAVRTRSEQYPAGSWIQGDSLEPRTLDVKRYPTRWELDAVAPRHPVVIRGLGRHVVAANSLALAMAGIDRSTPDPPGGRLERDATGEPTGVLHEQAKLRLDAGSADTVVPAPDERDRLRALRMAIHMLHAHGIACIHEMAREPHDIGDYLRLREDGALGIRVRLYVRGLRAQTRLEWLTGLGLRSEMGDEWIMLGGVKFSVDGADWAHNAALYQEYPGEPGNSGLIRIEAGELRHAVMAAHRGGLQVAVHAIGPRAVDTALDAFEAALREAPRRGAGHRIEHAYLPLRNGQLERMAELGLIWSTQPSIFYRSAEDWAEIFGEESCARAVPLATAARLGIDVHLNSDYPCSPVNPFIGIHAAVTRVTEHGNRFGPGEAIPVTTALAYMTRAVAYSTSRKRRQGTIAAGNPADVIVTNHDPRAIAPGDLLSTRVQLTMVGGDIVYREQ